MTTLLVLCLIISNLSSASFSNVNREVFNIFSQNTDVARTKAHRHWYLNQGVTVQGSNVTQVAPYRYRTGNYKTGCFLSPVEEALAVINIVDDYGGESPFLPLPSSIVQRKYYAGLNPFALMLEIAYGDHRPVILTPDLLWHHITKGVAEHIKNNAQHFQDLFVYHHGKKELVVSVDDFGAMELLLNKNEQAWSEVFHAFGLEILENTTPKAHTLRHPKFSTTTPVVEDTSIINLMDSLQSYFSYSLDIMCGIPYVSLLGTEKDWITLRESTVSLLEIFQDQPEDLNLTWWAHGLLPVLDQMYYSYVYPNSDDSIVFMQSIFRTYSDDCGGSTRDGWFNVFFPFLENYRQNPLAGFSLENHLVRGKFDPNEMHSTNLASFQRGISSAPFVLTDNQKPVVDMTFVGGPCCVTELVEGNKAGIPVGSLHVPFGWAVLLSQEHEEMYEDFIRNRYRKYFDL